MTEQDLRETSETPQLPLRKKKLGTLHNFLCAALRLQPTETPQVEQQAEGTRIHSTLNARVTVLQTQHLLKHYRKTTQTGRWEITPYPTSTDFQMGKYGKLRRSIDNR